MSAIISVEEVSLSSATVQIETITVRGKKVTQALFRQFVTESPFEYENDHALHYRVHWDSQEIVGIKGNIWGWVNYFPEKYHNIFKPINVIWQKENELRRCVVEKPYEANDLYGEHKSELPLESGDLRIFNDILQLPQLFIAM